MDSSYLNQNSYIMERGGGKIIAFTALQLNDMDGKGLLFLSQNGINKYHIKDNSGNVVCEIHKKAISMSGEVDISLNGNTIGVVKSRSNALFGGILQGKMWTFYGPDGIEIADAIGDILGMEYTINDPSNNPIAVVTRKLGKTFGESLAERFKNAYQINIINKESNIPLIIYFIFVIDLENSQSASGPHVVIGPSNGGFGGIIPGNNFGGGFQQGGGIRL
ncbi:MAG: hypothetical protein ACP5RP_04540 [Candidatus Micrarchaeia archaeon]